MMKVTKPDFLPGNMSGAGGGRSLRSSHPPIPGSSSAASSLGSPILEVFVRPQAASGPRAQRYLHQAVSLRLPTMEEVRIGGVDKGQCKCAEGDIIENFTWIHCKRPLTCFRKANTRKDNCRIPACFGFPMLSYFDVFSLLCHIGSTAALSVTDTWTPSREPLLWRRERCLHTDRPEREAECLDPP